jgi:dolichol-phosphate mannosyltransferase
LTGIEVLQAPPVGAARRGTLLTVVLHNRDGLVYRAGFLQHLVTAFGGLDAEILVVDDDARQASVPPEFPVPVRVVHRPPGQRRTGLGGAVMAAAQHAHGEWILVLDASLQPSADAAAALARTAIRHDVDIVVGTRHAGAGTGDRLGSAVRAAKALFPRRLATVSDPMSGLFAFRAGAVDLDRLDPLGGKVLMELLVRNPAARVAEVAYEAAPQETRRATASVRAGATFIRHLSRLRLGRFVGQLRQAPTDRRRQFARLLSFGTVGLSGVAVNTAALWLFYSQAGLHHLVAAALATQLSTAWNFLLVEFLVYRGRGNGSFGTRGLRFFLMNNLLLIGRLPLLQVLLWTGLDLLVANAVTLVVLFLARFVVSDRVIYGKGQEAGRDPVLMLVDPAAPNSPPASARKRSQYLQYRYDIAGTVTIGSQILLPELEFFRAQWVPDAEVDIAVRVGDVGHRRPRLRAAMIEYADPVTLRYEEHLGRLGANFRVELGSTINIHVGPLLARSPHVVYTNILEALLRFVLVSRGRMLLHSACVELDGVGVMLSALTDTGKTATVLRLLRDHGGKFLSDDMTVIDADGTAVCFPKPLTISSHTLRAVQADDLTPREWRRLQFQSRLHSKGGRSLALTLSRFNVPIMGINAITQSLVPPPKYTVDRLVPCRLGSATEVRELFIIERGTPRIADLDPASTLERMIENTDDAYGFPPFRYFAPAITIGGLGYQQLRARERAILTGFLSGVRTRIVASDCFGWADEIPRLLERDATTAGAGSTGATSAASAGSWPTWARVAAAPGGVA